MIVGPGFLSKANDHVNPPAVNAEDDDSVIGRRGQFTEYATGIERGYEISGSTEVKIFLDEDETEVKSKKVTGLTPGETYPSHVHLLECDDNNGGGHYQYKPGGSVDATNEIWPFVKIKSNGIGKGKAEVDFAARPDEVKSVVIHDTDGARIACADLVSDKAR